MTLKGGGAESGLVGVLYLGITRNLIEIIINIWLNSPQHTRAYVAKLGPILKLTCRNNLQLHTCFTFLVAFCEL